MKTRWSAIPMSFPGGSGSGLVLPGAYSAAQTHCCGRAGFRAGCFGRRAGASFTSGAATRVWADFSDGGDNHSRYSEDDIKRLVREADIQLYAIGIFESGY